ncbi:MAG: hybrid sensor histidine kinase/response regulator [Lachnospiraceae bacterium]
MANNFFTLCSFFYSLMLTIIYFKRKNVKTIETKIYSSLIITNILNVSLAVMCYFTILYKDMMPFINDLISKTLLLLFITWELFFTGYVIVITRKNKEKNYKEIYKKSRPLLAVLYILISFIVYVLPLYYHNENKIVYSYGPSANFIYALTAILIITWIILIIKNYQILKSRKCIPVVLFIVLTLIVVVIQKQNPGLLLITATETFITIIMYFTIENPDMKMLDEVHKAKVISDNANEEKTLFLYNMTNEIRGITKDIDKETDNILDETDNKKIDVEEINNSARNIKGSTAKFTTMTNEILDISSIDSASVRIYNEKYNIKRLLKELVGIYKPKAQNKNLDFRVSIASDIPEYLYGDGINLKKVLTIILDNSIKYTNNGYIEFNINTIIKGDIARLIISVEDSGTGMKAEDINKIFTKKQEREDNHNLNNNLYNAKRLITLMNGTIVPSSSYGSGTTIKIILDQKYDTIDTDINKYDNIYDKKKVLLIDDSPSSEKLFNKILSGTNIELTSVKLGKEGLEKIRNKEKYDLILLDEELEPQNGHIIMRKLLEIRNFNIKVILLTKDNKYDYDDSYLQEGFTDYIIKSSDKEEILNKMNKYLS